ncbi:DUF6265 family protein [Pseudoalteromonas sp. SMS1]|uniref:DUF6265 family protein n=1 Tax=Pseudoalteromonas sp. SMS1 TaxID=2908894 RepID=UPI001F1608D8|nr:DUF6265 family protein [Pseudoalteromonas sp. SMS1]MCF2859119.1 DUF6265 family protein [Pseudoalteromonas sp. SMS1]
MLRVIKWVLPCFVFHAGAQAKACDSIASLSWLVGHWYSESRSLKINESWQQVSGKTLEGAGETYSIKKGKMVSAETLRIVEMSGEVFYIAKVASNEAPVAFKLTRCAANTVIFENPHHDFPKKLHYQAMEEGQMTVFVSGEKGKAFSIKFRREHTRQ